MIEPRRLLDESTDDFETALLRAGRDYHASAHARQRTLTALGLLGGTTLLGKLALAATTTHKVLAGGTLAALVGTGAVALYLWSAPPSRPASTGVPAIESPAAQPVAEGASPTVAPGSPPSRGVSDALPEQPTPPAAEVVEGRAGAGDTVTAPSSSSANRAASLEGELKLVDSIRQALAAQDGAGALKLLDQYARLYPRGKLGLEAEVLRIEALSRTGRTQEAQRRAATFLAAHPQSVFAERLRRRFANPSP